MLDRDLKGPGRESHELPLKVLQFMEFVVPSL